MEEKSFFRKNIDFSTQKCIFFGPQPKTPKYFTHTEGPYQRSAKFKNRFLGRKKFSWPESRFFHRIDVFPIHIEEKSFFEKVSIFRPNKDLSQGGGVDGRPFTHPPCRRSEIPRKKGRKLVTTVSKKLLTRCISNGNKKIVWALSGFQKKSH